MNCTDARNVWNHPKGYIAGLRQYMPGVVEELERLTQCLVNGSNDAFDAIIKKKVGAGSYYIEHAEEGDALGERIHDVVGDWVGKSKLEAHLSKMVGRSITIGNMCCQACTIVDGPISAAQLEAIQVAAVNTDPPG